MQNFSYLLLLLLLIILLTSLLHKNYFSHFSQEYIDNINNDIYQAIFNIYNPYVINNVNLNLIDIFSQKCYINNLIIDQNNLILTIQNMFKSNGINDMVSPSINIRYIQNKFMVNFLNKFYDTLVTNTNFIYFNNQIRIKTILDLLPSYLINTKFLDYSMINILSYIIINNNLLYIDDNSNKINYISNVSKFILDEMIKYSLNQKTIKYNYTLTIDNKIKTIISLLMYGVDENYFDINFIYKC
jgi:hypothetical protein